MTNERALLAVLTNERTVLVTSDVLQVSVAGQGVAGARVTASLTHVDNNGGHHTLEPAVTLSDDGAAGDDL